MKSIEVEGKTVEEALDIALNELSVDKKYVGFEVLDHGSKGLFNVIGVKPARIKAFIKYDYVKEAENFLIKLFKHMNIKVRITIKDEEDILKIDLSGDNMGIIIGYRGENLDSIQYLVSLIVNKIHVLPHKRVIIDTENYRSKREETLRRVALKTADKVKKNGRIFKLEPMNPYERRIIHSTLQDDEVINTYSEGNEPYRRVVVELNRNL